MPEQEINDLPYYPEVVLDVDLDLAEQHIVKAPEVTPPGSFGICLNAVESSPLEAVHENV
jgi:hypothetical protein